MKFGVLVFPGSNCDHDTYHVVETLVGAPVTYLWHASEDLQGCDAILVPGGFAYGDYLRTGAIAKFAPVMQSVAKFAKGGGLVMGICNGFQILCEAGLLPGVLMRNKGQQYICKQVHLRTETTDSPFTRGLGAEQVLKMPIGHMEGNYFCDEATLAELNGQNRVAFRYADASGAVTAGANPNGSLENIAGVLSEGRNVLGLMPHPDRSSEALLGSSDGLVLFKAMAEALSVGV
ncbi:phosphoribosylformylglycinamidine synthase subunit I [Granulicella pectinivorans]|jgi:phosphoribosylformylglycinamidine synthase|uniref:Phosphoribosylformylglycinamidine synthase subunit PurQ n=1 Tax=Granulicella pectinivorans TaxID=474950 RepID=A0A1I6MGQ5_9BACT|nr:phosphoribosylformylglycinamidine synthase subunit PurQ [Granulicella pectinivorans]SFS14886.1 phosphoribosylformylglycinamidine synthase subunit I [Granulicella pectinivorans]